MMIKSREPCAAKVFKQIRKRVNVIFRSVKLVVVAQKKHCYISHQRSHLTLLRFRSKYTDRKITVRST